MNRKDFVAIAAALADAKPQQGAPFATATLYECAYRTWMNVRNGMADTLAKDNPRFDRERFYTACEGQSMKTYEEIQAYRAKPRLPRLPKNQERIGQYSTIDSARIAAKREGYPHRVVKTTIWRDCIPYQGYTIVPEK